ncbi:hypothetical protein FRACYDRAFT_256723 [Fragilariopsis cylindrus CCMP1102]|uniref:Uncharacterized protein n=1 Tax=Fragilariopsis cylindrus CCMP1102 TaxID=635003 RepID=A0A1E7EJH5_9STRA|nr:hypothetical protein FRACYDRAFT_256723 [Fragilariopsis cylindrus CCMP1102]|eukprot:OEU06035.1 hypothetical protein FRACYDRAFT_256723 [Fragilariopsis cylindrus CCMP1102]
MEGDMENKRQSASFSNNVTQVITPERNTRAESRRTNHSRRDVETYDRNAAAFATDEEKYAFIIQWIKEQSDAMELVTSRSSKKNKSAAAIDGEDGKKSCKEYDSGDSTKSDDNSDDSDDRTAPCYSSDDGDDNDDENNKGSDGAKVVTDKYTEGIGYTVSTSISISRPKKRSRTTGDDSDDDDDDDEEEEKEEEEGTKGHHTILGVVSLQRKVDMYRFCKRKSTHFETMDFDDAYEFYKMRVKIQKAVLEENPNFNFEKDLN